MTTETATHDYADIGRAFACGCIADEGGPPNFLMGLVRCPLHASAPDLLAAARLAEYALASFLLYTVNNPGTPGGQVATSTIDTLRAAIEEATP